MADVIDFAHYKTARLLMTILHDRAEAHAHRMASRMARQANSEGRALWQGVGTAIEDLRRKRRPRSSCG
jgi:hypothetical protein